MSRRRSIGVLATVALLAGGVVAAPSADARPAPSAPILASSVVGGALHSCALTTSGGVECWGYNGDGELGNGTLTDSKIPVNVSSLSSGVVALAAGAWHTCALLNTGGLVCWGDNDLGQLGDGTTTSRSTPVSVSGLSTGVAAVSAGQLHTCALTTTGAVDCWGYNGDGEVGDGTTTNRPVPTAVPSLTTGVTHISAGGYHSCAVMSDGSAQCWGANDFGDLGDGTTTASSVPVVVAGLAGPLANISAGGAYTCAVSVAGGAQCWGSNRDGQLGDGTGANSGAPVNVSGLTSGVAGIAAGLGHACAVTTSGAVQCWGDGDDGDLGNSATTTSLAPVGVTGLGSGVASIGVGEYQSCAVLTTGVLDCWGSNTNGQVGDGTTTNRPSPVTVNLGGTTVVTPVAVSIGSASTYEGDVGSHLVEIPVTLRDPASSTVTIGYSVYRNKSLDTATPNVDFVAKVGTLTFAPASNGLTPTVGYVPVTIIGDTVVEGNETFSVILTSASSNATLVRKSVRVTILDDDPQSGIRATVSPVGIVEGNTTANTGGANVVNFHVVLSQPVPAGAPNVVVGYTVTPITATGCATFVTGCDFISQTTKLNLTFAPGQNDLVIPVSTFPDTAVEPNETFSVKLVSISAGATIGHAVASGTIINDD
jgi:alpha-tubulin suppressor-like RCC1 family protein